MCNNSFAKRRHNRSVCWFIPYWIVVRYDKIRPSNVYIYICSTMYCTCVCNGCENRKSFRFDFAHLQSAQLHKQRTMYLCIIIVYYNSIMLTAVLYNIDCNVWYALDPQTELVIAVANVRSVKCGEHHFYLYIFGSSLLSYSNWIFIFLSAKIAYYLSAQWW